MVYGKRDLRHRHAARQRRAINAAGGKDGKFALLGRQQAASTRLTALGPWLDYTVNGLIIGNIYALLAVGLALIFGVANLINFAHGSVYMVGAYIGWAVHHLSAHAAAGDAAAGGGGLRRCSAW